MRWGGLALVAIWIWSGVLADTEESNVIEKYLRAYLTGSSDAKFGQSVANLGDLDADNISELVIGVPDYNNGEVVIMFLTTAGSWYSYAIILAEDFRIAVRNYVIHRHPVFARSVADVSIFIDMQIYLRCCQCDQDWQRMAQQEAIIPSFCQ
mgnify:CR=1 FL=1